MTPCSNPVPLVPSVVGGAPVMTPCSNPVPLVPSVVEGRR